ncbi:MULTISPECIES: hypothetical protein [unclassified Pseudoalteromonas]|uniref:hypothetical protein n=1 Tax=unclassified Pseudoalteromonas TaxID=194690 RepID=UPI0004A42137|nr:MULTISPECIES: hypothetical protein [unclassified Pseudoalteromonas]MBH0002411.1 hypothetical protein [Pseudoalteromonas sp. SWYJZ12]
MKFEDLPLHDATITSISYLWEVKALSVNGNFFSKEQSKIIEFTLSFNLVTGLSIPHNEEWGPSSSINGTGFKAPLEYYIEMQSGDVVTVEAVDFNFNL